MQNHRPTAYGRTKATLVIHFDDDRLALCLSGVEVIWMMASLLVKFPKPKADDRQPLQELVLSFAAFKTRRKQAIT